MSPLWPDEDESDQRLQAAGAPGKVNCIAGHIPYESAQAMVQAAVVGQAVGYMGEEEVVVVSLQLVAVAGPELLEAGQAGKEQVPGALEQ